MHLNIPGHQGVYPGDIGTKHLFPGCVNPDLERNAEEPFLFHLESFDHKMTLNRLGTGLTAAFTPKATPQGSPFWRNTQNIAPDEIKGIKISCGNR